MTDDTLRERPAGDIDDLIFEGEIWPHVSDR